MVFALSSGGGRAALAWTGAALIGVVLVATAAIAGPINSKFLQGDEGQVPADAERLRNTWRRFHGARTVAVLAAVACVAAAAVG